MLMRISAIVFAVPGIILLILYGIELSAITNCQELGLFYDAHLKQCTTQKPPFNTFYTRNPLLVNGMLAFASLGALSMCLAMLKRPK